MSRRRGSAVTPIGALAVGAVAAAGWWLTGAHPADMHPAPGTRHRIGRCAGGAARR
jgi:ferric-dicitrate binding protein FerR (iron transport regulator)